MNFIRAFQKAAMMEWHKTQVELYESLATTYLNKKDAESYWFCMSQLEKHRRKYDKWLSK